MILFGNYIFLLGTEHNWQLLYKRTCQICADSGNCPANFHFQSKCQSFKILNILLCRWLQGNACSHALCGQEEQKRCNNSVPAIQQFHVEQVNEELYRKGKGQGWQLRLCSHCFLHEEKTSFYAKNQVADTVKDAELKVSLHQTH